MVVSFFPLKGVAASSGQQHNHHLHLQYDARVGAPQHVAWAPLPANEEPVPKEEYMPPGLSKEEAVRLVMEQSKLLEIGQWDDLGAQLLFSAFGNHAAPSPPPPPTSPEPEPPVG
jgi:hypothetical protein